MQFSRKISQIIGWRPRLSSLTVNDVEDTFVGGKVTES